MKRSQHLFLLVGDSEGGGGANERQMGMENSKSDKHKTSPEQSSLPGNRFVTTFELKGPFLAHVPY